MDTSWLQQLLAAHPALAADAAAARHDWACWVMDAREGHGGSLVRAAEALPVLLAIQAALQQVRGGGNGSCSSRRLVMPGLVQLLPVVGRGNLVAFMAVLHRPVGSLGG